METHPFLQDEGYPADSSIARFNPNFNHNLKAAAGNHAATLHPESARGNVVLAQKIDGRWEQRSYPAAKLPEVIPLYAGERDTYLTQQRYAFRRTISQLVELQAMFAELDFHDAPETDPRGVLEDVLIHLEDEQIPYPSLAIFSGRGLHLIWLHTPVPRDALPRWMACQEHLGKLLKSFGWDRGAKDGARVLRLCGTVNGKSGRMVEEIQGTRDRYDFETLCSEILPIDRAELRDLRIQRAARDARTPRESRRRPVKAFTQAGLAEARITDLQRLRQMRWFGDLPPGQRDYWMFVAATSMSWLAPDLETLTREMHALAKEAAGWHDRESRSRLQAVKKRARMALDGKTVEWNGVQVDPRYRFRNDTLIELLEITAEEEREMVTLISKNERLRRHRQSDNKRRRKDGVIPREKYEATAQERKMRAAELRAGGMKQREIAEILGCTQQEVSRLIKGLDKRIQVCAPLYGRYSLPEGPGFVESGREENAAKSSQQESEAVHKETSLTESAAARIDRFFQEKSPAVDLGCMTADEIRRGWADTRDHDLGCDCPTCSTLPPRYVRYAV